MSDLTGRSDVRTSGFGLIMVPVEFTAGASGAVSSQSTEFNACTVAVVGATDGQYTFTFAEKYTDMFGVSAVTDYQGTVVDGSWAIETGYSATTGTVTLVHVVGGSDADPASGTVNKFVFFMKNSSL